MSKFHPHLLIPFIFILLYGSGFVFTKFGLENSSPMAFLSIRFFIAALILLVITYFFKSPWPKTIREFIHISVAGSLTVGTFSIGVFLSLSYNIEASLSSLIIALQPILVAFFARKYLNENVYKNIWWGLWIGFIGVFFVVGSKLGNHSVDNLGVIYSIVGLFGLTAGALYQKKYCSTMNLFSGGAIQTFSSALLTLPFLFIEEVHVTFNGDFMIALLYMSIGVSIGALSLLYLMIQSRDVSKVSSIFYLVPVSAVIISYLLFDIAIDMTVIVGVIAIFSALFLINKKEE